jgi:hypothetical protein
MSDTNVPDSWARLIGRLQIRLPVVHDELLYDLNMRLKALERNATDSAPKPISDFAATVTDAYLRSVFDRAGGSISGLRAVYDLRFEDTPIFELVDSVAVIIARFSSEARDGPVSAKPVAREVIHAVADWLAEDAADGSPFLIAANALREGADQ